MSWNVLGFQRLRDNQITLRSDSKTQGRISLRFWELALLPLPYLNINDNFKLRTKCWARGGMGVHFSSRFEAEHETGLVFRRIAPWVYTDDAIISKKLRWRLHPNSSAQNVPIVQFDTTPTQWNSSNLRSASTTMKRIEVSLIEECLEEGFEQSLFFLRFHKNVSGRVGNCVWRHGSC